jgi:cysteine desulfurase
MSTRIYLDWNATAPVCAEAHAAVTAALGLLGNPSSVHGEGRAVRKCLEEARAVVADLVGAEPRNVIFTSGGTEANVLALGPWLDAGGKAPDRLLMSAVEHPSVRSGHRFAASLVEDLPVDSNGVVDLSVLAARLDELSGRSLRPLVSIMHANNETGVIQPIVAAADIVHGAGGLLHVDAVQSVGRVSCKINELSADFLTLSGHKLGAPTGVGALVTRNDALHLPDAVIKGGGQERGRRAGTENVLGIIGFGAAAAALGEASGGDVIRLRDRLEAGLRDVTRDTVVFGQGAERVPNTTLFAVPDIKAETALIALDLAGMAVSSGAACSSGKVAPSHVLAAMGVPPRLAQGAIRVSLGPTTEAAEIDFFLKAWRKVVMRLSKGRSGLAA